MQIIKVLTRVYVKPTELKEDSGEHRRPGVAKALYTSV